MGRADLLTTSRINQSAMTDAIRVRCTYDTHFDHTRAERSGVSRVAPPWGCVITKAALKGRNNQEIVICYALSGLSFSWTYNPGRRCALPWADMFAPFQGKVFLTCVQQKGSLHLRWKSAAWAIGS